MLGSLIDKYHNLNVIKYARQSDRQILFSKNPTSKVRCSGGYLTGKHYYLNVLEYARQSEGSPCKEKCCINGILPNSFSTPLWGNNFRRKLDTSLKRV